MTLLDITQGDGGIGLAALISSLGGGASLFIKFIVDKTKMRGEIEQLKEKLIEVTATKKAMKVEILDIVEKTDQVLHARIDRVRDDNIKSYEKLEAKISDLDKKYDMTTEKILDAIHKMK